MKKLVFICAVLCLLLAPPARAETLKVAADFWCPYNCEPNSDAPGVIIEIAQKAFAKHNIQLEYTIVPWTRAIEETRKGKYDGIVGASMGDAPDFIFPNTPQAYSVMSFFVKPETKWVFTDAESLKKISLGVIANYAYDDGDIVDTHISLYKRDAKRVQIVFGDNALDINIKKTLQGRIDATLENKNVMAYTLAKQNLAGQLKEAGSLTGSENQKLHIALSPKNQNAKKYADILATETQLMLKNGEIAKILKKYGLTAEN